MAAATVLRLQGIVSREGAPTDAAVITIGVLQAGTEENVIPDFAGRRGGTGGCRPSLAASIRPMVVNGHILLNTLLVAFDLGGTFVFALSGATAAVKHRLDLFGVLVLSFAAGNSGGIARDVMIGAVPPAAISDWRYVAVSILAGLITFCWSHIINRLSSPVLVFDAAGLSLFAVAGASKALAFHAGRVAATWRGMLSGSVGGVVRDVVVSAVRSGW